jgi:hypothetical protein
MTNKGFEILQYSICDGWINNLLDGDKKPYVLGTLGEAVAELQEEFDDWNAEIARGDRDSEDGFDIATFQISDGTGRIFALDMIEGKVVVGEA